MLGRVALHIHDLAFALVEVFLHPRAVMEYQSGH